MSAVKNTMEVINGANQRINNYYDMSLDNLMIFTITAITPLK